MNGKEIYSLIGRDPLLKTQFLGVFAADELPSYIPVGKGLIVNCCNRDLPGRHWLAIYQSTTKKVEFFDSFGRKPSAYGLKIKSGQLDQWSDVQLQNIFSNVCGLYCIFYLLQRVRGTCMSTIVNKFSRYNTLFNDDLLRKEICKHFYFFK